MNTNDTAQQSIQEIIADIDRIVEQSRRRARFMLIFNGVCIGLFIVWLIIVIANGAS